MKRKIKFRELKFYCKRNYAGRLSWPRLDRSHPCCRGYTPGLHLGASPRFDTAVTALVWRRSCWFVPTKTAVKRQVTTNGLLLATRLSFFSRDNEKKEKGETCTAALYLRCESAPSPPRARPRQRCAVTPRHFRAISRERESGDASAA